MFGLSQGRHRQKSEAGVSVAPKMDMCPPAICFEKKLLHKLTFKLTSQTTSYRDSITERAFIDSYKTTPIIIYLILT